MTDIAQEVKKSEKKKAISKTSKTDETLLKDAKERIMRLQVCLLVLFSVFCIFNLIKRSKLLLDEHFGVFVFVYWLIFEWVFKC
jgi:hypothetical protein